MSAPIHPKVRAAIDQLLREDPITPQTCARLHDVLMRDDRIEGEPRFLSAAAYIRAQLVGRQVVGELTPLGADVLHYCAVRLEPREWAGDDVEGSLWQDVPRWTVRALA